MRVHFAALLGCVSLFTTVAAAGEPGAASPTTASSAAFMASLAPQKGEITLPGGIAKLNLGSAFEYLNPADAQRLLEVGWHNPPGAGAKTLGMILPTSVGPLEHGGWGVVVTYVEDGHVNDDDAGSIDYNELLKNMQDATQKANEQRVKLGYKPVTLGAWAEPPHYDRASHKMYWAKDLAFGDNPHHTLNYFIRVLGRKGVLELNAVAGMSQLPEIRDSMQRVVTFADFTPGNGYTDFDSSTDKVAAYGLAALVAGGIAAKTGLLAKLLALIVAAKKLVFVALAGVAGFFKKIFRRKPRVETGMAPPAT